MKERVWVTGMGVVSALGKGVPTNLQGLRNGQTAIGNAQFFESRYTENLLFGEININHLELQEQLGLSETKGLTRTDIFAAQAFTEAVQSAQLSAEEIQSYTTALISGSTVGGMCITDQLYQDSNRATKGSEFLASYGPGAHCFNLAQIFGVKGMIDTFNTACSSSANAIMLGARLIQSGKAKRVIVGGVDTLAKYTVNGFNALAILCEGCCKPFDENRTGLNLGEGAAYLVLEAASVVKNKPVLGEVCGWGVANDAYHPSSISPEAFGVVKAMQDALLKAQLNPADIDYINAHGTATPNNDEVEWTGIEKVFQDQIPDFSSTKSFTGHTLGASGALEAVFSLLAIQYNEIYPNLNLSKPLTSKLPVQKLTRKKVDTVMSNAFGFGGNCTSLIFKRHG